MEVVKRSWKIKLSLTVIFVLLGLSIFQPLVDYFRMDGDNPIEIGVYKGFLTSSWKHPLGTDYLGRDMLSMLLVGIKLSLFIGIIAGSAGSLIAISLGFIAAYKGGIIDDILRSFIDAILVIPTWPIFAVITAYVRFVSLPELGLAIAIFSWPSMGRTLRAQALSLKERPYIDLAKVSGLRDIEVIFKEMIPNLLPYILAGFAQQIMLAIFTETGLRIIGIGPPMLTTLGYLIQHCFSFGFITTRPHVITVAVSTLVLIFITLNIIIIGLEEEANPRLKKITGI